MSENILEVKGLTKDYGDFVLDKLTFTVPKGVIMGLIGENGAGKSTTINCINLLSKHAFCNYVSVIILILIPLVNSFCNLLRNIFVYY